MASWPGSACAMRSPNSPSRPGSPAARSMTGRLPGSGGNDENASDQLSSGRRRPQASPSAAARPDRRASVPLAFALARLAHPCLRLALRGWRNRYSGAAARCACGDRGQIAQRFRDRSGSAVTASAAPYRPRRGGVYRDASRPRRDGCPIRRDGGATTATATASAGVLAKRRLAPHPHEAGAQPLGVSSESTIKILAEQHTPPRAAPALGNLPAMLLRGVVNISLWRPFPRLSEALWHA